MLARLGVLLTALGIAIALQTGHYYILADIFFVLCAVLVLEAAMFNFLPYSPKSLRIGKGEDAKLIKVSWPLNYDVLCVPVSLRFPRWKTRDIRFVIKSSDITINSVLYDLSGNSSNDDTYTLDWENSKGWISIAYLDNGEMVIGTPTEHKYPGRKQHYPIILEVWHHNKLLVCSNFILGINMCLSDDNKHNPKEGA